jgi:glycosyltransferase 2 family protein
MTLPARLVRPLLLSVVAGLALYAGAMVATDAGAVSEAAGRLALLGWLAVLGLSTLNYLVRFGRWHWYLGRLGDRVPVGRHLAYYLAGLAFATTPGKAGEAIRSLYLQRHAITFRHSLAALFVERLVDLGAIVLLALSAAWAFAGARWPVALGGLLVFGLLALVRSRRAAGTLDHWRDRAGWPRAGALLGHLADLLRASSHLLRARMLYGGLVFGLLAWGAEGLGFWLILDRLGAELSPLTATGIYAAGILAGALSFIPGGLGSTEAVMVLLLGLTGLGTSEAVAATLICRIATLWFAVAIGLGAVAALEASGLGVTRGAEPRLDAGDALTGSGRP